MKFIKKNPCVMPNLFLLVYGIPIIIWISNFTPTSSFILRGLGLIAFINIFTQIMLGSFRKFFNEHYNPKTIRKLHNTLGIVTLIIALTHGLINAFNIDLIGVLTLKYPLYIGGAIGLYIMLTTAITSILKYSFKVKIKTKTWRTIHLLNYALFIFIYIHAFLAGTDFKVPLMQYLTTIYLVIVIIAVILKISKALKKRK